MPSAGGKFVFDVGWMPNWASILEVVVYDSLHSQIAIDLICLDARLLAAHPCMIHHDDACAALTAVICREVAEERGLGGGSIVQNAAVGA